MTTYNKIDATHLEITEEVKKVINKENLESDKLRLQNMLSEIDFLLEKLK